MSIYKRFEETQIAVSINKDIAEAQSATVSDVDKPYTLVEWIVNVSESFGQPDHYIEDHKKYVKSWYKTKHNYTTKEVDIDNEYVKFLREILLVYTTAEEARYLKNIDWDNLYEREIAVPFYAKRLRDVVIYVSTQRDKIKLQKVRNSFTGSYQGVKKFVYDEIINLLGTEKYYIMFPELPKIETIVNDLNITINEYYDSTQTYFNQPGESATEKGRFDRTDISAVLGVDFNEVVLDVISNYKEPLSDSGTVIANETGSQLIPGTVSTLDEIDKLPEQYFINYVKGYDNINLHDELEWSEKYYGVDQYVLSSDHILHRAVEAKFPTQNHLNVNYPTVATRVQSENLVREDAIGGYFKNTGISHFYSLNNSYIINYDVPLQDNIQIPDPVVYSIDVPNITYRQDVRWMKADLTNDYMFGDLVDVAIYQKMYGYQSTSETNRYDKFGISRAADKFDFWEGDYDDVWSNSDIYEVILPYNFKQATEQRTKDLVLGSDRVIKWRTDVFGNEYAMLKPTDNHRYIPPPAKEELAVCRLLDGNVYWDDITYIRPDYNWYYDGGRFIGTSLSAYEDFAITTNFDNKSCDEYEVI